nr:reverse transcriptase domain-containing protein [Tanacetum cinerariifolium]
MVMEESMEIIEGLVNLVFMILAWKRVLNLGWRGRNHKKRDTTMRSSNDPAATNEANNKHDSKDEEVASFAKVSNEFSSKSSDVLDVNNLGARVKPYSNTQEDTPYRTKPVLYANMINDKATKPKVNFRTLVSDVHDEADFDVKNPIALVEQGKVFEVVENSKARNVESKLGEKLIKDNESDMEVTYDESAQFMATKVVIQSNPNLFSFKLRDHDRNLGIQFTPRWDYDPGSFLRTTNLRNEISNFQQRFDESFHEAWDRYKDILRACPHHGFTELHQLDTFYNALNPADQDSLNSAAAGNLLERRTQDVLMIIENKSKVRNSRNKSVVSQVKSSDANSNSFSEIANPTHAVNQQTSAVTTAMTAILKQFQATPPTASVKSVEEICVTCGGAHPYYQCLTTSGNTIPELRDNIQGYVAAAAVNYNQGNSVYCPPGSGSLHSNTIANPKGELKAINTQSGIVLDVPFLPIPPPFINLDEDEHIEETLTDQDLAEYIIKKKLGLPKLISTHMTLELANRAICTPTGIARDVFVLVGKFTFPADFVIVDYESDPRVLFILGRPFLRTVRALIDVHGEEMILRDDDERLTLNMRHDTPSYSNQPQKESINLINGGNVLPKKLLDVDSTKDLHPPHHVNPLSGSTTSSLSLNQLLKEFTDELALITFPSGNDDLPFDIDNLADPNDNLVDTVPEMFTDEHALDYSFSLLYDKYDDDLFKVMFDTKNFYNDPFESKGKKIKESKLLIDELDLPYDFISSFKYDSFLSKEFSKVDALPLANNEDKVFHLGILIHENLFEVINYVAQNKNLAISHASLFFEDFDPPLYELPFFKKVPSKDQASLGERPGEAWCCSGFSESLPVVSSNPSTSNPKRRNRRRSKQPDILEESPIDTMADQRTMAELLRAPTEGYKDLLRACPHHGFIELHQLDTFHNALNPADQDSFNAATGGNLLERRTQDLLTIIKNKSMVRNTQNKSVVSQVKSCDANSNSSSEIAKLTHAVNQQTSADNIQGYVSAATVNYNQGNSVYRPLGSGSLPSNTVANPKGELKAITTRSGIVIDGPTVPPTIINPKVDEHVEETLTDLNLSEYTIKKLGLPENISTRINLELANRAICSAVGIARDVFILVGKFTFPADIFIVDYESDPRVPLILGRPFLRTTRALIDVHEDLFSNQPSGNPTFSYHPKLTSPKVKDDIFDPRGGNVLPEKLLDLDFTKDLYPPLHVNPLSGSTTYSSSNPLLKEFVYELALITFPSKYADNLQFDIESDLKEIEFLLYQDTDSSLKDSIDQSNLTDNFVNSMHEMFADEHALDYSSPSIFDEYNDDFFEVESDAENVYDELSTPMERKSKSINS